MRVFAALAVVVWCPLFAALTTASCESSSAPSEPDSGGTTIPTADGAVCGCASPDCLPNCSDLPPCKAECVEGERIVWVDPCGNVQFTQACPNGCVDAATPKCQ